MDRQEESKMRVMDAASSNKQVMQKSLKTKMQMSGLFKAAMRANYHKDENGFKVIYTKVGNYS